MLQQLLTPTILAVFATGFAVIWLKNRQLPSAGIFALAYASAGLGFLIEHLLTKQDGYLPVRVFGDICYMSSALFVAIGLSVRFGQSIPRVPLIGVYTVTFASTMWYWFIDDSIQARTEIISYGTAMLIGLGAASIHPAVKTGLDRLLFSLMVISSGLLSVNAFVVLHVFGHVITDANFGTSLFLEILNFSVALASMSSAMVLFIGLGLEIIDDLKEQSTTDPLTRLNNRRSFETRAQKQCELDLKLNRPSAIIVCDIDHFKSINDRYGHTVGDRVIRAIGKILQETVRSSDIIGRVGGEEFVVLLENATESMARLKAESLRVRIANAEWTDIDPALSITASFGVAEREFGEDYPSLFKRADRALYRAKDRGRDHVVIYREQKISQRIAEITRTQA